MPLREDEVIEVRKIVHQFIKPNDDSAIKDLKATIKKLEEKLRLEIESIKSEMQSIQEELKKLKEPEKPKVKDFSKK